MPYSLGASLCSHRVIHIRGYTKGVPYQVHNPITFTLPKKGPLGLSHNGDKKLLMTFLRIYMMTFQPINLNSIIPLI